jgi:hypothetical protein
MASPFPGMDPYLEDPFLWTGVHARLITYLADHLNQLMPKKYVADINERVYLEEPDRNIFPDVAIREKLERRKPKSLGSKRTNRAAAVPPVVVTMDPEEIREVFIEIMLARGQRRVVTAIEVLSPTNKAAGSEGRRAYREKQREVVSSPMNLLEIDLLRAGEHSVLAPRYRLLRKGHFDYVILLSRDANREICQAWPVTLRKPLPAIFVPLGENDEDVVLDLQPILATVYESGAYEREIEYRDPPAVALREDDLDWANTLLRRKGLRK